MASSLQRCREPFMAAPRLPVPSITKRIADAAQPRDRRYLILDGLVHGFALKVEPSGTKVFIVQKSQAGRSVRVTIGRYPDLTVDQARREAQDIVLKLLRGGDPTAERRAALEARRHRQREARRVTELWGRYLAEVIVPHNRASTAAVKLRMWERRIAPVIGHLAVHEVTSADLSAIVRAPLRVDARGRVTGGKGEAANLHRLLHHVFKKALAWRMRPLELGHPLDGIEQPRVPRRERLLSDAELAAFLAALDRSEDLEAAQLVAAARLAVLTGWRISELLNLRWDQVRRDLGEAHLPDTKTGFSARPLAPEALALLDRIERRPGVPWVLPGITDPRQPLDYNTVLKAFRRFAARAGLKGITPHTLRHRVTTDVAGASPNIRTGMAVTGHKSTQAFLGYVHAEKARSKAVAAEVAGRIAKLAQAPPAETVVALKPKRRGGRAS
jgi:integrase